MPRDRLLRALDHAVWQPLTLVCAAAGSGKSTLVTQWLDTRPHAYAWLSLEPDDDHPVAFVRGLLGMLAPHLPELAELAELADVPVPHPHSRVDWLVDVLSSWVVSPLCSRAERLVMVFDDVHHVTDPDLLRALEWLIDHLPQQAHIILISRTEPPLPLARLQVRGEVTIIGSQDLRFSPEESMSFYNDTMALDLTSDDVVALETRNEGWAAAIQLSALSLRAGMSATELAVPTAARRDDVLARYLTDEILVRQPASIRRFLLRTSILERFDAAACEALTGEGARANLERLERENLFLVRLDAAGRWFRYHHLFGALLRDVLARSDEDGPTLHRLACTWALQEELPSEAFRHALGTADHELIVQVIRTFGTRLLFEGKHDTLRRWFDLLPADFVEQHPDVGVHALWARVVTGQPDDIERTRRSIELGLDAGDLPDPVRNAVLANVYAAMAFSLHLSPRTDEVLALLDRAKAHLDNPNEHPLRVTLAYVRGAVLMSRREFYPALEALRVAGQGASRQGNHNLAAGAIELRIRILGLMGRFAEATELIDGLLSGQGAKRHGFAVQQRGWIALCLGEFDRAKEALEQAIDGHTYLYSYDHVSSGRALLAATLELQGDSAGADVEIVRALESLKGSGADGVLLVDGILAVHRDDPARARATVEAMPLESYTTPEAKFWHAWIHAWWRARTGELGPALEECNEQIARGESDGGVVFSTLWRSLEGSILEALGRTREASRAQARVRESGIALASALRTPLPPRPAPASVPLPTQPAPSRGAPIEPLSAREVEVLSLMAQGMTNRAIAGQLHVSVATVKTHVHRVIHKLDAGNRTEAVHYARSVGLLT